MRKMRRVVKVFNEAVVVWNEEKRGYGVLASSKMKGCFFLKKCLRLVKEIIVEAIFNRILLATRILK